MLLAACYTVFNGLELLEKSIAQIESEVDWVIIGYQTISNKGNPSTVIEPFLERFRGNFKYHLVHFEPDLSKNTKENERKKHQSLLNYARILGCTHVFLSACDHFYDKKQIPWAKKMVLEENLDITFTRMYTYYKHPEWQLTPLEDYYMPFIIKLSETTRIERMSTFPLRVDPSVQINTFAKWILFPEQHLMLHHYSMIRTDIKNKFDNAAASIRWTEEDKKSFINEYENYSIETNPGIKYFGGRKIKWVPNWFNL